MSGKPTPTETEITAAVEWMVRELLPDLREIAARGWGTVTIALQDGRPHVQRGKVWAPGFSIYPDRNGAGQ